MSLTDSLPALPDITGNHSYPASTSTSGSGPAPQPQQQPSDCKGTKVLGYCLPNIQSIVFILLGLLLIAAGIFTFREVRQTVVSTAKTAAKVAAVA